MPRNKNTPVQKPNVLNADQVENEKDNNVSQLEKELLERSSESMASEDDEARRQTLLDNEDEDGDALNEKVEVSGDDLDVPGAEEDDANEAIGEEDEENNSYSLGGDGND